MLLMIGTSDGDLCRGPFLQFSILKATGLETLNIAKKWFSKISIIQHFFVCCICR